MALVGGLVAVVMAVAVVAFVAAVAFVVAAYVKHAVVVACDADVSADAACSSWWMPLRQAKRLSAHSTRARQEEMDDLPF